MEILWPPLSCDLNISEANKVVPVELYNLIAWIVGASDDPVLADRVKVENDTNTRILSICQDIAYLASSGRRPTPKSLALGLTVRHLTGSSQLLNIISRFGHCISPSSAVGYETALAQYQLAATSEIPKGMVKKSPTVLVWDNIDFGEETLSGKGTTHHTNEIMVQGRVQSTENPRTVVIKKGARTLKPLTSVLEHYYQTKRQGPQDLHQDTPLLDMEFSQVLNVATKIEFIYIVLKYAAHHNLSDEPLPGWTGFNYVVSDGSLPKSALYYLPVIEASPTEMATVNTILWRSVNIADQMELDTTVLY